jgi:hypothetical protein
MSTAELIQEEGGKGRGMKIGQTNKRIRNGWRESCKIGMCESQSLRSNEEEEKYTS